MLRKKQMLPLVLATAFALGSGAVWAESTAGYNNSGTPASASARVQVEVQVPTIILLRVGSAGATVDEMKWWLALSPQSENGLNIGGNPDRAFDNEPIAWDGEEPSLSLQASGSRQMKVAAWTNNSSGFELSHSADDSTFGNGGPELSDILISRGSGLLHPGGDFLGGSGTVTHGTPGLAKGTWNYYIDKENPALSTWAPGKYSATVTYTATTL